jgi:alpha-1,6-mannosyltransferase
MTQAPPGADAPVPAAEAVPSEDAAPSPRPAAAHSVALAASVGASVALVVVAPRHSAWAMTLVAAATAACAAVVLLERRNPRLDARLVAAGIGIVMVTAVATPPHTSNDVWSYGAYGRMVSAYDVDPYTATPAQFPHDPIARRVSAIWRHRSSVYGPLWIGVAAADAALVGTSTLANRLFFQVLAALAAAAALVIVWRSTHRVWVLAWLGLHPVFGAVAVNNGHADLLIGLAVLVAALLALRRRPALAGMLVGLAALVKVTALLALVGLVLWAWRARRRGDAGRLIAGAIGTVGVAYAFVFGAADHVLANSDHTVTPASPWNGLADLLVGHDAGRTLAHPLAFNASLDAIFFAGVILVVALALVLGWRAAGTGAPTEAAGTTAAAYPVAAAYCYPWYSCWALPALAADRDGPSPLGWVVWLESAVALGALKMVIGPTGTLDDQVARGLLTDVLPLVLLAAFVVAGFRRRVPHHATA